VITPAPAGAVRLLHVSDVHFGAPAVLAQIAGVDALVASGAFDAIIVSGDLSQRARIGEFQAAARLLAGWREHAPVLVVPGNHDTAWWEAPVGIGDTSRLHRTYRAWIDETLEPELRIAARAPRADGKRTAVSVVGLLSAHGIRLATLTTNLRHLSVIGLVRPAQWARVGARFGAAPADDVKVLVLHHNLRRGRLSNRWGLRHGDDSLRALAASGADLALCGHDHEEQVAQLTSDEAGGPTARRPIVACAGTISNRSRGHRPSSVNIVTIDPTAIDVAVWPWDGTRFVSGPNSTYPLPGHG
jgi:3',5'-cyclic AMP phosphodiesterase CpdA